MQEVWAIVLAVYDFDTLTLTAQRLEIASHLRLRALRRARPALLPLLARVWPESEYSFGEDWEGADDIYDQYRYSSYVSVLQGFDAHCRLESLRHSPDPHKPSEPGAHRLGHPFTIGRVDYFRGYHYCCRAVAAG